jgi:hypothetical protein
MSPVPYVVIGAALMFAAHSATAQVVWNPTTDFSTTNGNPNGVWTYGWMDTAFTTFTVTVSHNTNTWLGNLGGDGSPVIWLNTSTSSPYGVPPGDISLHPGPGTEPSILRWTAPPSFSGTAHVAGQFLSGDTGVMQVEVRFNGNPVWSATNFGAFVFDRVFVAGDQLDFAVFGGYDYGNTPLVMSITSSAIPEPSTCAAFFGVAVLGVAVVLRRMHV